MISHDTRKRRQPAHEHRRANRRVNFVSGLLAIPLAAALVSCATNRFQSVDQSDPHGVIAFPSQEVQRSRLLFLEPVELNGLPRPRNWMQETYRVPPGDFDFVLRAATDTLQGRCRLGFFVTENARYAIDATFAEDVFTLRVTRDDTTMDTCVAAAEVLPTPLRIPGVPSAH